MLMALLDRKLLRTVSALVLLTACTQGEAPPAGDDDDDSDTEQEESSVEPPKKDAGRGQDGGKPRSDAGAQSSRTDGGAPSPRADAGADSGKSMVERPSDKGLPCAIAPIVSKHCAECHGDEPAFGADFSLTSVAHFQAAAGSNEQKKLHEVAAERVSLTGARRMPPSSKPAIAAADLTKLTDWLKAGAKSDGELCPVQTTSGTPMGDAGVEYEPAGSGGSHTKPIKYDDPDMKCYPLVAYGKSDRMGKYAVPTTPDLYVNFLMKAPWTGTQYVRSFRSIIDNKEVIHHWLLFKNLTAQRDGVVQENASGTHPDGELMMGWAPGADDMYLDPDVGMAVSGSDTFLLEAHYNNKNGMGVPDASGVEVCVTPKKPTNVAALTWVGTDSINGTTATGQCNSTHSTPVRMFSGWPHMHTKGKHMKVVVNRKSGMKETIHDKEFDFEYQKMYGLNVTLMPGDTLTTTCTYTQPARFGKGTNDEMCYFFTHSWPAGALTMPGLGTVLHGPNSCL